MFTNSKNIPDREDPQNWPTLRELFAKSFLEKTRKEWEDIFDGTDACVTPVKSNAELKKEAYQQVPPVVLKSTPAVQTDGWGGVALKPGQGGKKALEEWWGLKEGRDWVDGAEGCRVSTQDSKL
jgi:alpha-methylacyl-CoA racemase